MKKSALLLLLAVLIWNCSSSSHRIDAENFGVLHRADTLKNKLQELSSDSLVIDSLNTGEIVGLSAYNAQKKLSYKIRTSFDGLPEVIQVFDPKYTTRGSIGVGSTFGSIRKTYTIERIVPAIKSVSISVKGEPFIFLIEKSALPENLRYSMSPIEAVQIDDQTPVSQVLISW